jgi:hypothetical protein
MIRLPDDIEQSLLDRRRSRATLALMVRRSLTLTQARILISRWLHEQSTELRKDPSLSPDDA